MKFTRNVEDVLPLFWQLYFFMTLEKGINTIKVILKHLNIRKQLYASKSFSDMLAISWHIFHDDNIYISLSPTLFAKLSLIAFTPVRGRAYSHSTRHLFWFFLSCLVVPVQEVTANLDTGWTGGRTATGTLLVKAGFLIYFTFL